MPIYQYRCPRCSKTEDRFYKSYADMRCESVRCIDDGSLMERVPSAPQFKVTGFNYANGYSEEKS